MSHTKHAHRDTQTVSAQFVAETTCNLLDMHLPLHSTNEEEMFNKFKKGRPVLASFIGALFDAHTLPITQQGQATETARSTFKRDMKNLGFAEQGFTDSIEAGVVKQIEKALGENQQPTTRGSVAGR